MFKINEEANYCLLCSSEPCTWECPQGFLPAKALRSVRFGNVKAAGLYVDKKVCANCAGNCEQSCVHYDRPIKIKQVIDVKDLEPNGRVVFGVTVTIENLDTEEQKTYRIVGDDEADFKINKISVNSPIARGLLGKNEGDEVKINTPQGEVEYEIVKVEYL